MLGCPDFTRAWSGCGSGSEAMFASRAAAISAWLRLRTKMSLPRQNTLTI
jgi:hypothetical protein